MHAGLVHLEADGAAGGDGQRLGVCAATGTGVAAEVNGAAAGGGDGGVVVAVLAHVLVCGGGGAAGNEGAETVCWGLGYVVKGVAGDLQ